MKIIIIAGIFLSAISLTNYNFSQYSIGGSSTPCGSYLNNEAISDYYILGIPSNNVFFGPQDWIISGGTMVSQDVTQGKVRIKWSNSTTVTNTYVRCIYFQYNNASSTGPGYTISNGVQLDVTIKKMATTSLVPSYSWNLSPVLGSTSNINFAINPVDGAEFYNWELPVGWSSGWNSPAISVNPNTTSSGNITVSAGVYGCPNLTKTYYQNITRPFPAGTSTSSITGSKTNCGNKSLKYSVELIPYATNYSWTIPIGWQIQGQHTNVVYITAPFGQNGTGNISCIANRGNAFTIGSPVSTITMSPSTIMASAIVEPAYTYYSVYIPPTCTLEKSTDGINWTSTTIIDYTIPTGAAKTIYLRLKNICGISANTMHI